MPILTVRNISKSFLDQNNVIKAVNDVTFEIEEGEVVAVIGPSGSGKTTLLNLIGILMSPDSGEIIVDGISTKGISDLTRCNMRNKYFGYVVQDFALIEDETAAQNILIPSLYSKNKTSKAQYRKKMTDLADRFLIKDKLHTKVKKLSGGERQRVAIIRALICDQKIILADEPTGSLDNKNSETIINFLKDLAITEKKSIIIATHNLSLAERCDRIFKLTQGSFSICR